MEYGIMFLSQKIFSDTITVTTSSIYTLLKKPTFYMYSLDKYLYQFDIIPKLKAIEAVLKIIENDKTLYNEALDLMIISVHDMIKNIQDDLHKIEDIVLQQNNKWFASWRSLPIDSVINDLKVHLSLLDNRYDLLIKTISITRK
jgi:hypothetical protein